MPKTLQHNRDKKKWERRYHNKGFAYWHFSMAWNNDTTPIQIKEFYILYIKWLIHCRNADVSRGFIQSWLDYLTKYT